MIRGQVSARREAFVPVRVRGLGDKVMEFQALVDTGFTGSLSLPPEAVAELELPYITMRPFRLAGEIEAEYPEHAAIVEWDGRDRGMTAIASDGPPTIGMALLYGFRLLIDVVDGGEVTIEPRKAV